MNKPQLPSDTRYSIKVAARRTGLSAHAIRAWERRHNAVSPRRDSNNRRFYTEEDIKRLTLLKKATDAGFGISQVVDMGDDELKDVISSMNVVELPVKADGPESKFSVPETSPENYVEGFMQALLKMDSKTLENILTQAEIDYGINATIENVLVPLMERVGDGWRKGTLRISHEHLASHVVRTFLGGVLSAYKNHTGAPGVLVTTPSDQWHDIGALIMAVTVATEGWNVTYLGANLPAEEIAGSAKQNSCRVVVLSIVYPEDDPSVVQEIKKLRRALPDNVVIVVGGRASANYSQALDEVRAVQVKSLYELRTSLESLRSGKEQ